MKFFATFFLLLSVDNLKSEIINDIKIKGILIREDSNEILFESNKNKLEIKKSCIVDFPERLGNTEVTIIIKKECILDFKSL